jgi:hypothetical protein
MAALALPALRVRLALKVQLELLALKVRLD